MLTSISPLGERARGNRWPVTVAAYVLGSGVAGAAVGGVLGLLGDLLLRPLPLVAAAVCLAAAAADLAGLLPRGSRQVDEDWLVRYRGWVYGLAFGGQLGVGVATIVTSAATIDAAREIDGDLEGFSVLGVGSGTANGSPAYGQYKPSESGSGFDPWALQVLEFADGRSESGRLPNRGIEPRLLYHRHFMLTEQMQVFNDDIDPHFDDTKPSIPVPFTSAIWGSLASFGARAYPGTKKWYGASGNSFDPIVASGPNGAKPHARPTDRTLQPGELVAQARTLAESLGGRFTGEGISPTTSCRASGTAGSGGR